MGGWLSLSCRVEDLADRAVLAEKLCSLVGGSTAESAAWANGQNALAGAAIHGGDVL